MQRPWLPLRERVQTELLKRGHCVGCTRSLADAERKQFSQSDTHELVLCTCSRVFVYDKQLNSYRRATLDEWDQQDKTENNFVLVE